MEKIREKEEGEARAAGGEVEEDGRPRFPPKVGQDSLVDYCRTACCVDLCCTPREDRG